MYIPEGRDDERGDDHDDGSGLGRARLVDINPWAPRTDALLFDWAELLALPVPGPVLGVVDSGGDEWPGGADADAGRAGDGGGDDEEEEEEEEDEAFEHEVRLIEKEDPAAYNFGSSQFSAHKLPKEVVDASLVGEGGMREFSEQWMALLDEGGTGSRRRRLID